MGNAYTVTDYSGSSMSLVRGESIDPEFTGVYLTEEAASMTTSLLDRAADTENCFLSVFCWKGASAETAAKKLLELIKSSAECRSPINLFVPAEHGARSLALIDKEVVEMAKKVLNMVENSSIGDDDDKLIAFEASKALSSFNMHRMDNDFPFCVKKSVDCYLFNDTNSVYCYVKD